MAMTKLWKFLRNIQDLNWGQGVEVTKTGAEAAKAVLDLAKAIKEQKPNVKNLQPYVEQISSLTVAHLITQIMSSSDGYAR
ncbi:hypothetical protein [Nostoc sp.]|uniref:hypothetical protein n=1 Tax=Nostoc sp. TaxID=1180 RepID=UPI002FF4711D